MPGVTNIDPEAREETSNRLGSRVDQRTRCDQRVVGAGDLKLSEPRSSLTASEELSRSCVLRFRGSRAGPCFRCRQQPEQADGTDAEQRETGRLGDRGQARERNEKLIFKTPSGDVTSTVVKEVVSVAPRNCGTAYPVAAALDNAIAIGESERYVAAVESAKIQGKSGNGTRERDQDVSQPERLPLGRQHGRFAAERFWSHTEESPVADSCVRLEKVNGGYVTDAVPLPKKMNPLVARVGDCIDRGGHSETALLQVGKSG